MEKSWIYPKVDRIHLSYYNDRPCIAWVARRDILRRYDNITLSSQNRILDLAKRYARFIEYFETGSCLVVYNKKEPNEENEVLFNY